jgi:LemA protein
MPIVLGIVIVVLAAVLVFFIGNYNALIQLRNRVKDQWSQIDIQLKRRFDLVPNLVETVKGYTKHEKETLENVVKARNAYQTAKTPEEQMKADGELTKTLTKLFALAEAYPDLKANDNFMELQTELSNIEEKISASRQFYSDSVLNYNNKVQMFPSNIVASIFGFKEEKFFEAQTEERENVKVKFDE